ncbi:MAG: YihY/virulence factor BrkB family protein [Chloroflexota bacterium]|nr:MAG: YihY/virulence factor BrkB family protein [Chloroflexota bacterium]
MISQLEDRGRQGMAWLDRQTDGWFVLFFEALRDVLSFKSSLYGAATAYFALFSIFPLILLTLGIASFWLDPQTTWQEILSRLEFVVPALDDLLGNYLDQIAASRGAVTRLSAVALVWSASSIIYMFTRAMDDLWEGVMVRPAWRHRALAIAVTLATSALLLMVSIAWGVVVPVVNSFLPDQIIRISPYLSILGSALLNVALFALLYYMLPNMRMQWIDVILGAIFAGLLWEVAKRAFLFFVTNYLTASNLIYGSMTTIIVFLTWAYISSLIFLFGGHVNVRYKRRRQRQREEAART